MKLKRIVDSLEGVDEKYHELYVEKDGKFVIDDDGADDSATVAQLRADLRKVQKEAGDRRKLLEKWEKAGKTPEEIEELLVKLAKDDEEKLTRRGEWDKLRQQMVEKHEKELQGLRDVISGKDKDLGDMTKSLENHLVDSQLTAAIAQHKGIPTLLLPHAKKFIKVDRQDDGSYKTNVVDDKGGPRVNGKGEPLPVADLILEMKGNEIFGRAFEGSGASGSGMPPGGGGGGNNSTYKKKSDFKSEKERAAFVDEQGLAAYQGLPA